MGSIRDTYVAALQHDLVDVSDDARLVGVVRRPTAWFNAAVDENYPVLAPPDALLTEFKEYHEDLKLQGMCDEGAHNNAWEELGFEERYLQHLDESTDAQAALQELAKQAANEDIVLVCFENTNKKRCHRTALKERLEALQG